MGPIIILDKSTFQSLSRQDHLFLNIFFIENLTPILGMELLGDLSKQSRGSRTADQIVTDLAKKFGGSGPTTNIDNRDICLSSLLGKHPPMDGRILPQNMRRSRRGYIIGLSPLNEAVLNWSKGKFEDFERQYADYWRKMTQSFNFDMFIEELNDQHVILPRVDNLNELPEQVDALLNKAGLQRVWLNWLLRQLSIPIQYSDIIWCRWNKQASPLLKNFSPYAWHCVRVMLMLAIATHHRLLRWSPTNFLDIQYLYYLPFCMVFASGDHVHQALAPFLARPDQSFVRGEDLKSDLHRIANFSERLSQQERMMVGYALGSYPPPANGSVVHELWKKHMRPWRPPRSHFGSRLNLRERNEATQWVERMFREVESEEDLAST